MPDSDNDGMTNLPMFVDLYELTMMQAYLQEGLTGEATFSLFVRTLPESRNYLIACGLDTVLQCLEGLSFREEDISYLSSLGLFTPDFVTWLRRFRFTGDVYAMPEGTAVFGNEPLLEIVAPLPQAQFVETLVLNQIHLQTLLASKAARVVTAAAGRKVVDFGARRLHGTDAAIKAARAFYVAGVAATSNVAAGATYGIPVTGTMAHSYVEAHETEEAAFRSFLHTYPDTTLLIDTYDTVGAARLIASMAVHSTARLSLSAVRLDSGDLASLSRQVRSVLDQAGLDDVRILASGGLDEYRIARLLAAGAQIDSFGVGTSMGVSADCPSLDMAYKLVDYEGRGRLKLSTGKSSLPGRKQVYRFERDGKYTRDELCRWSEARKAEPLLRQVMRNGERCEGSREPLPQIRERVKRTMEALPSRLHDLEPATSPYDVTISPALAAYEAEVRRDITRANRLG